MRSLFRRIPTGTLAQDTAHVAFWQAARIGGQALWVILVARLLGAQGYGTFTGIAGLATAIGGFTGLGLGLVMLQDVARDAALFGKRWQQAITVTLASGFILALLFMPLAEWLFHRHATWRAWSAIALSEILLFPIVSVSAFAFSSRHYVGTAAALPALMALCRVLAAITFWLVSPNRSLDIYVWFHAGATWLCACLCWLWVIFKLRPNPTAFEIRRHELMEGCSFSMVWMVNNALTSFDKTLVLRLTTAEIAGFYAACYRFATVLALPVEALTMAAGPRLFRHGGGVEKQPQLIPRLLIGALLGGVLMAAVLWMGAGLLPLVLGPTFSTAVPAARWMALFVPCYGLRLLGSNVLMTHDGKWLRIAIESGGVFLLAVLAWLWLPHYGLKGAVAMITVTEAMLGLATWLTIWRRKRTETMTNL